MILQQKAAVYLRVPEKDEFLIPFKSVRTLLLSPDCKWLRGSRWGKRGEKDVEMRGKEGLWIPPKEDWDELTVTKC